MRVCGLGLILCAVFLAGCGDDGDSATNRRPSVVGLAKFRILIFGGIKWL